MTSAALKKITTENISMLGNIVSSLYKKKSSPEDIKKAYAVLLLAEKVLDDAFDIEEVYNTRKLFAYAFESNNMEQFINDNPFIKLSKRNFEETYRTKNLIKRGELNLMYKESLQRHLKETLVRLRNYTKDKFDISEYSEFVENNAQKFINVARNS